jgi:hypothetical protein
VAVTRKIILLEKNPAPQGGAITFGVAFWLAVPAGQESPRPNFVSAVLGADAPDVNNELPDFVAGKVLERTTVWTLPDDYTAAEVEAFLERAYGRCSTAFQPPGKFYGAHWDGAAGVWAAGS